MSRQHYADFPDRTILNSTSLILSSSLQLKTYVMVLFAATLLTSGCNKQQDDGTAAMNMSPSVSKSDFGNMPDGAKISLFTVTNSNGIEAKIITYGGIITSLKTRDKNGNLADIVLGFDELEPYLKGTPYFGALIGRYGNRIAGGKFSIGERTYQLDTNHGPNHLHGGIVGFDKKVWSATPFTTESSAGVKLFLESEDGDQGYPGTMQVTATYTLTNDDELITDFHATTDKTTIVNLTQHSYFNLAGKGTILDHQLIINADHYTPVDSTLIPTGEIVPVANTPFDFRVPAAIGARINEENEQLAHGPGYDHNYVLNRNSRSDMEFAARVVEPNSGRVLEIYTQEPGIQFYSGNLMDGTLKSGDRVYAQRTGFCLEPQHHPDSPNQAHFPSTILEPGEEYTTRMSFKFSTTE
jgi:aldose 1-epimerase